MKLYNELAEWWPVLSAPEDYAEEASLYARVFVATAERPVHDVLELGSGGGNNASHLKEHFTMTLVEPSMPMLEVSRRLNPECEHIQGDMRTVRVGRDFDAVFVHDAVMYMTTADDLSAAMRTAYEHLRPGGVAVFVPDDTTESYEPRTIHGGHDRGPRSIRYLEWTHPPREETYIVSFVYLLREGDGPVRHVYDEHVFGTFPRDTWLELLEAAGFDTQALVHRYGTKDELMRRELFVGLRPGSG